jgi:hypothetical protein
MELMKMTKVRFESSNSSNRNKQSGFAIGVVFLVLVLIGAIMSAITLMSSASQDTSRDNENRSLANGVIRDGAGIANAVNTLISANGLRVEQVFMFRDRSTAANQAIFDRAQNILGPNGSYNFPQINLAAYNPETTCSQTHLATEEVSTSNDILVQCVLTLSRVKTTNYGQGGNSLRDSTYLVWTAPLTEAVAKQVNNLLWQAGTAEALPVNDIGKGKLMTLVPPTTVGAPTALKLVTDASVTANAPGEVPSGVELPVINGGVRPEGVWTRPVDLNKRNFYYKVYSSY